MKTLHELKINVKIGTNSYIFPPKRIRAYAKEHNCTFEKALRVAIRVNKNWRYQPTSVLNFDRR